jgi:hypothetical protein
MFPFLLAELTITPPRPLQHQFGRRNKSRKIISKSKPEFLHDTEDIPFEEKMIYLHFFIGACDWYIAECSSCSFSEVVDSDRKFMTFDQYYNFDECGLPATPFEEYLIEEGDFEHAT